MNSTATTAPGTHASQQPAPAVAGAPAGAAPPAAKPGAPALPAAPQRFVKASLWSARPHYKRAIGLSVVSGLLMITPSWFMFEVYGRVLNSRNERTLVMLLLFGAAGQAHAQAERGVGGAARRLRAGTPPWRLVRAWFRVRAGRWFHIGSL